MDKLSIRPNGKIIIIAATSVLSLPPFSSFGKLRQPLFERNANPIQTAAQFPFSGIHPLIPPGGSSLGVGRTREGVRQVSSSLSTMFGIEIGITAQREERSEDRWTELGLIVWNSVFLFAIFGSLESGRNDAMFLLWVYRIFGILVEFFYHFVRRYLK